jgi:hypothetical protein
VDKFFLFESFGNTTGIRLIGLIGRHGCGGRIDAVDGIPNLGTAIALNLRLGVGIQGDGALSQ